MYTENEKDIRSRENVKANGEVFTPTVIVEKMLDQLPENIWKDPEYVFLEPTCGNGQFLVKIFERRIKNGMSIEVTLNTIIGMDITTENILESRQRLYELVCKELSKVKLDKIKLKELCIKYIAIISTNIFKTDSLKAIQEYSEKKGKLYNFKFFFNDPTGNACTLNENTRMKQLETIKKLFETNQGKELYKTFHERLNHV